VYRYALSQVRTPQDAEDAAQNTFLRAFAALQRGIVPENESAWLFKIAHNVCATSKLAWLRRRRVETPRDLDTLTIEPAARESQHDELLGLGDALAGMPPRIREAFLLREWQGLSYEEIAKRLDTTQSAVETLIFRARRALAAQLQALGLGPLLNTLRALFQGASPLAKVAAVAVLAGGATVASVPLRQGSHPPASAGTPARVTPRTGSAPAPPTPGTFAPSAKQRRAPQATPTTASATAVAVQPPAAARPPASTTPAAPPQALPAAPQLPAPTAPQLPVGAAPQLPVPTVPAPPELVPSPVVPTTAPAVPVPQLPPVQLPTLPAAPAVPPLP
jgi:RNA polymerase sigma-70 factor (ECF subfamily)